MPTSYISQITLPTGSVYTIKDTEARQQIQDILDAAATGMHFIGVTSTELADLVSTNPIVINDEEVTAVAGDVVIVGTSGTEASAPKEFVFNGTKWQEFGSTGSLKGLAFKDSVRATYTPAGTIAYDTSTYVNGFSGTEATISVVGTPTGSINIADNAFTGTEATISGTLTPNGSVEISTGDGTTNYTPTGSNSAPNFTGSSATIVVNGGAGTTTYTPAGTINSPDITVTPTTTTISPIATVGTMPSFSTSVTNENLTLNWTEGAVPTKGTDVSVVTGVAAALASDPTFTGTGTRLTASYTPEGDVSAPTFVGDGVNLVGDFTGSNSSFSTTYTPQGTIGGLTFNGSSTTSTGSYTPEGTLATPKFTGIQDTIISS